MSNELRSTDVEVVGRNVDVEAATIATAGLREDWDTPAAEETPVIDAPMPEPVVVPAPRGAWEFTDAQRLILALLLWLNLLMFAVGYLAVTGRLRI